ncbi:MAG: hypothetical protein AB1657_05910 [Candidatus Micrarchaeota archaeon]
MEGKMKAGVLAMLLLLGMGFAADAETVEKKELPIEIRAQWMEAVHTGDYETAKALNEEYGIGGKMMKIATPEIFGLHAEIFQAMKDGDWVKAVQLKDELRELVKERLQEILPQPGAKEHFKKWKHGKKPPLGEKPPFEGVPLPEEVPLEVEIAE